jgi:hypothetical protein
MLNLNENLGRGALEIFCKILGEAGQRECYGVGVRVRVMENLMLWGLKYISDLRKNFEGGGGGVGNL